MAFGDIFRPKHKHSKSEVRAAAVAAMSRDDVELLVEVASGDKDAAIRRSAISKLSDPEALAQVAKSQEDKQLRDYASSLAVEIWVAKAISAEDLATAKECFNRAAAHGGERAIAEIAGLAQNAEVRSQALGRLEDNKALGQVVRKSGRAEEWQEALSRITDVAVLRGIAVDEKRKEVAVAALDRIEDADVLEEIAGKAKSKAVRSRAKRSRAALSKASAPASGVSDEEKRARAERVQLARELEQLAGGDEWLDSRDTADAAAKRWEELGAGEDSDLITRFERALARYNKNHELYGKAAQEAARKLAEEERKAAEAAAARSEAPRESRQSESESSESIEAEAPPEQEAAEQASDVEVVGTAAIQSEASAERESEEEDKRLDNQDELERLCEQLEELIETDLMKGFDRTLKETDKRRRKIGALPKNSADALRDRYDEARRKAVIKLGELREADDWKRWANVPKMEALVKRAKELVEDTENKRLGESLKVLQKEWRELGPAPREKGEELWQLFKSTCDEVYERVKSERDSRNAEQKENLAKKEALCERADELKDSTDWEATGAAFKEMQTEWKSIGPVPRRKSDALWKRFRGACDAFFEARAPHLEDRLSEFSENLEAKQKLIQEIEALAQADGDVEEQISAVKVLQRRFRDIGHVARQDVEAVGAAYKAACDAVYAKREAQAEAQLEEQRALIASLEEKIVECADAGWDSDAAEIAQKVIDVRATYQGLDPSLEGYEELGAKVASLIRSQLESEPGAYKGTVLDPERSKEAREALIARAEELAPEVPAEDADASPEEMAEKLRAALADRALGGVLSRTGGKSPEELVAELRGEWSTIAPLPGAIGSSLLERFEGVCSRILASSQPE